LAGQARCRDAGRYCRDLQDLRRWLLGTRDAHGLYARFGFTPLRASERFMERHDLDVYARMSGSGRGS
jgi:hypothetical protein